MNNREILFRGKTNKGIWAFGLVAKVDSRIYIYPESIFTPLSQFEILPETLGQFTGLVDKSMTKIFEGDILEFVNPRHFSEKGNFEVEYKNGCFFAGYHRGSSTGVRPKLIVGRRVNIIGNIHDNPELLEGGQNA